MKVIMRGGKITSRLPDSIESALFRIAQESLTNISKHAQAKNVKVNLKDSSNTFYLSIEDDGKGFDMGIKSKSKNDQGWGIFNMKERVHAFGGKFDIVSEPGTGTRVSVEVRK